MRKMHECERYFRQWALKYTEMYNSIGPSGKLLCLWNTKNIGTAYTCKISYV